MKRGENLEKEDEHLTLVTSTFSIFRQGADGNLLPARGTLTQLLFIKFAIHFEFLLIYGIPVSSYKQNLNPEAVAPPHFTLEDVSSASRCGAHDLEKEIASTI
jgi:hypothetical protein